MTMRSLDEYRPVSGAPPAAVGPLPSGEVPRPWVIAHRGFSGAAPENTVAAVRRAVEVGADMVEIDVSEARDGELVVLHDATLERTTDGAGVVVDTPFEAIRSLDAGAWFADSFAGERVPTLDEILEIVAGRIALNLEIKPEALRLEIPGLERPGLERPGLERPGLERPQLDDHPWAERTPGIVVRVAEAVRRHGVIDQVIVSCFDPRALAHLRVVAPELRTASLYLPQVHDGMTPAQIAAQVGSRALHLTPAQASAARIEAAHAAGLAVGVHTVNEPAAMRALLARGVDALFTDHPDRMLELLGRAPRRRPTASADGGRL